MDIIRNSVWLSQGTDLLAEGLYRVLDFDRKVDLLILFKIKSERTGKPIPFSFSMFKYYIYPSYMLVDEKELTDKDRGRRDENYNIIKDLVDDRMFLFDYALHKKSHLLMDYSRNKKISQYTIRTLLALYWRHGQDIYALLPAFSNCGAAGKSRIKHEIKLGNSKKKQSIT